MRVCGCSLCSGGPAALRSSWRSVYENKALPTAAAVTHRPENRPTGRLSVCLSISACASTYQPDGSFLSLLSEQQDNMKPFLSLTPPNIKQTLPLKQTRPTRSSDDIRQTFCRHQVGSSSTPE